MKIDINVYHNLTTHCKELCVYCVTRDCNEKLDKILYPEKKHIPFENIDTLPVSKIDPEIKRYCDNMVCIGCGLKQNVCKESCSWYSKPSKTEPVFHDGEGNCGECCSNCGNCRYGV